jgi:beta-glucanase (GH16 family)
MTRLCLAALLLVLSVPALAADLPDLDQSLGPVPKQARLSFAEDWSGGKIDPGRWYLPRKKWGNGNHGVTAENVVLSRDTVAGHKLSVLVCEAHGDQYDGPVVGHGGVKARVGGMIVSKAFFASGRFEVVMKIGSAAQHPGGPADPCRPKGMVPAIWTYAYRFVSVPRGRMQEFVPETPLYNPLMKRFDTGANEYWSELDFPEFGRAGNFDVGLYNAFVQNRHEPKEYDVSTAIDGRYHTFTTEWRTKLEPIDGVTDTQVAESEGFFWVKDKAVPFDRYYGNPLKRLGPNQYAVYCGARADHWIDGKKVAENTKYVPAMAAQLTTGVWLPDWAGEAPWQTATVSFASIKVWQYHDDGDVHTVLSGDLPDNFRSDGQPLR